MTILLGDALDVLKNISSETIDCVITSPPYFGLRDYGISGQIGLEKTPQEYIEKLVTIFKEIKRCLKPEGTVWLNLGDSYAGSWGNYGGQNRGKGTQRKIIYGSKAHQTAYDGLEKFKPPTTNPPGLKNKDLIGIPWKVAFALQENGWYLRQDIIWSKSNSMPESVKDRCTKSHEYIFLLAKSPKYYFDCEAIKEPCVSTHSSGNGFKRPARLSYLNSDGTPRGNDKKWTDVGGKRHRRSVWTIATKPYKEAHFATFPVELIEPCVLAGCPENGIILDPFFGAGTVGIAAIKHNRKYIGIEINPAYVEMANRRIENEIEKGKAA